jgi:hypothetical protein
MTRVTKGSIAYIATQVCLFWFLPLFPRIHILCCQVRFALSTAGTFSRSDLVTDSERFYLSVLEVLNNPDEIQEVNDLLVWWNRYVWLSFLTLTCSKPIVSQIFAEFFPGTRTIHERSPLALIMARRGRRVPVA